jgi:hypothetical protein
VGQEERAEEEEAHGADFEGQRKQKTQVLVDHADHRCMGDGRHFCKDYYTSSTKLYFACPRRGRRAVGSPPRLCDNTAPPSSFVECNIQLQSTACLVRRALAVVVSDTPVLFIPT